MQPPVKLFSRLHRRDDGFTLVELMVVVAIIGLLSTVAIPNFKKYQARAKTTEAKIQLSAIYTSEQSFFADYNIYMHCLRYMGYDPSGEASQRYYLTGFPNLTASLYDSAYNSAATSGLSADTFANGGCPDESAGAVGQTWFVPGKTLGTALATIASVDAGDGSLTLANSNVSNLAAAGVAGLGSQGVDAEFTFRAVASGIIDQDYIGGGTGSGQSSLFSINQDKRIFNPRLGY